MNADFLLQLFTATVVTGSAWLLTRLVSRIDRIEQRAHLVDLDLRDVFNRLQMKQRQGVDREPKDE